VRISIFIFLLVLQTACAFAGKLPPLTAKEIGLMLRSGYSSDAVQREVAVRHFVEAIDPVQEKTLLQAGATPAFISSLRAGEYAVPADEIAAVQKDLALREQRRLEQAEEARKRNTLYQSQLAQTAAAAAKTLPGGSSSDEFARSIRGKLVTSKNGILHTFNNQALEKKKLIGLYFAGKWCPSCRKFTPQLVEFYNRIAASHPELEIIFVSSDRSPAAMEAYMNDSQMPWPAVAFDNTADNEALRRYAGNGIPCLVLVGADGKVISDSYDGKTYLGPSKVLADLERILGGPAANKVAQQP